MKTVPTRLALLALALAPCTGFAGLQWDKLEAHVSGWAGDDTIVTVYKFRNTGTASVSIVAAAPSCHCTSVDFPSRAFAPGEEGQLTATFFIGNRRGQERKTISVVTDDKPDASTDLVLDIDIKDVAALSSDSVFWKVGEGGTEKTIEVTAKSDQVISSLDALANDPGVRVRVEKLEGGRRYILAITPVSTDKLVQATIECTALFDGKALPIPKAYAYVLK